LAIEHVRCGRKAVEFGSKPLEVKPCDRDLGVILELRTALAQTPGILVRAAKQTLGHAKAEFRFCEVGVLEREAASVLSDDQAQ
jgi:hypothetical protein